LLEYYNRHSTSRFLQGADGDPRVHADGAMISEETTASLRCAARLGRCEPINPRRGGRMWYHHADRHKKSAAQIVDTWCWQTEDGPQSWFTAFLASRQQKPAVHAAVFRRRAKILDDPGAIQSRARRAGNFSCKIRGPRCCVTALGATTDFQKTIMVGIARLLFDGRVAHASMKTVIIGGGRAQSTDVPTFPFTASAPAQWRVRSFASDGAEAAVVGPAR